MAGIYLHIPFCRQACHYCDFHFSTNTEIKGALVSAMADEISLQQNYLQGERVDTIYFGGGTPSLLTDGELDVLLQRIHQTHDVAQDAEVTLEANPDDLTLPTLTTFKSLGINRLSIGIQSFDDAVLRYLNRIHNSDTAARSVDLARRAGFNNITIDLIYAIPGLSTKVWKENLSKAIALEPQHISAYTLTIEEKTVFGKWLSKGKLKAVDETLAAEQLELLMEMLAEAGYRQYEISNFSIPGWESRHNSNYWKGVKYLGIGPGAHSFNQTSRQFNIANNHLYVRALSEKRIPAGTEMLKKNERMNEYILTSLRMDAGCSLSVLERDFDYGIRTLHRDYLAGLQHHKLICIEDEHIRLTPAGRLLADKIASDLFLTE